MNKNELRLLIKSQKIDSSRKRLEEKYLTETFAGILEKKKPACVGLFASKSDEVNLRSVFRKAYELDIQTAYPRVTDDHLTFHAVDSLDMLVPTLPYGIYEPVAWAPLVEPDLIVVPGIGFTKTGKRLGRGKGFYDRYLSQHSPYTVSLAFSWQVLEDLPTEEHDIEIQKVIAYFLNVVH